MMQKQIFLIAIALIFIVSTGSCQINEKDSTVRKFHIGISLFMPGNLSSKYRPDFVQLNAGYRITPKAVVSVELITWKYIQQ